MLQIPLQPVPSQIIKTSLNGQNVQLAIYQKTQGLFVNVNSGGVDIVCAVLAHDGVSLVCRKYMGFAGDLIFVDTQGKSDPTFDGLGSRYQLIYLAPKDIPNG